MTDKSKAKKLLRKVEDMIEEKPEPQTEQPVTEAPAEKPGANLSAKRRAALVNYLAGLLTLAFGAVLISMLVQQRDNRNTVNILTNDKTNALAKAEQLQEFQHVRPHVHSPGLAVFGAGDIDPGGGGVLSIAPDRDCSFFPVNIRPFQGASLTAPDSGISDKVYIRLPFQGFIL